MSVHKFFPLPFKINSPSVLLIYKRVHKIDKGLLVIEYIV